MENHIRLDDLLSRDVDVQWFEGVALVQSICQQLRALNISRPEFPPPSQTYLSADGSVAFAASSGGQGVVETAANVLAQMLNDDVPVRLRLVVTQATAGDGSYATLAELSEALAYFERPDSRQILRQLYERAQIASARPGPNTTSEPRPAVAAPPAAPDPAQLRPGHGISRVAVLVTLAAAILCAVIASVAFGYGDPRVFAALDRLKRTFAASSTDASGDAGGGATSSNKAQTGTAAKAQKKTGPGGNVGAARAPATPGFTGRVPTLTLPPLSLPELSPVARIGRHPADWFARTLDPTAGTQLFRENVVVIASERPARVLDGRVYSKEDARVTPPRSIYPKLPPESPETAAGRARTILELLITTDGFVERVRLRTPPRDVHEFMLVSAAKAWVFEPARVDGRPVRFLHRVPISTTP